MQYTEGKKTVLVTGASKGIGRAIALLFAKEGYDVAITCSSEGSRAGAVETLSLASAFCEKVRLYDCDATRTQDVNTTVAKALEEFKAIDVLINNAGIAKDGLVARMTDEQFDSVLDVNLKGAFRFIRACLPSMIRVRRGNIINISSIVGLHGNAGQANYAASKAGVIAMTKSAAREVASRGILVNAIAPGAIDTDMFSSLDQRIKQSIVDTIPLKRVGSAEEVAQVALFMARQTYITGQVIQVDGGMGI